MTKQQSPSNLFSQGVTTPLIRVSEIRRMARAGGKRVGADYLRYIERYLRTTIESHIHSLGSRKTLNAADILALRAYQKR